MQGERHVTRQLPASKCHRVKNVHPPRGPKCFIELGHSCTARGWCHPVGPRRRVVAAPFGPERELGSRLGRDDSTLPGPGDGTSPIVADKSCPWSWPGGSIEPFHSSAFGTQLTHSSQVTYDTVNVLRRRRDLNRLLTPHANTPLPLRQKVYARHVPRRSDPSLSTLLQLCRSGAVSHLQPESVTREVD
jgi:hypothetical protein